MAPGMFWHAERSEPAYLREKWMTSLRSTTSGIAFLLPDGEPADREIKDGRVNKWILLCPAHPGELLEFELALGNNS